MALTKKVNGVEYEVLRFPMKNLNISQGCNGQYSHQGSNGIDCCGKNSGIEPTYAPCTMKLMKCWGSDYGNPCWFQSVNKVLFADGTIDYATFLFLHDNSIADIQAYANAGKTWTQWQEFGDEGTAGKATGNHSHIAVAKGAFQTTYVLNSQGVYCLPGEISPDKAFVVDGVTIYNNGQPTGSGNALSWKKAADIKTSTAASTTSAASSSSSQTLPSDAVVCKRRIVPKTKVNIRTAPSLSGTVAETIDGSQYRTMTHYVVREGYVWGTWTYNGIRYYMAVQTVDGNGNVTGNLCTITAI
jgi:hypothetical protein